MDLRKLKTILELFESSNLTEMEFSEGEEKIRLSKAGVASVAPIVAPPVPVAPSGVVEAASPPPPPEMVAPRGTLVKSPMVGTFYRSVAPDRPEFVSVGQTVQEGDPLCIVEAMKLMNEIPSPVAGVVTQILIENGSPVGYGDDLFIIE